MATKDPQHSVMANALETRAKINPELAEIVSSTPTHRPRLHNLATSPRVRSISVPEPIVMRTRSLELVLTQPDLYRILRVHYPNLSDDFTVELTGEDDDVLNINWEEE